MLIFHNFLFLLWFYKISQKVGDLLLPPTPSPVVDGPDFILKKVVFDLSEPGQFLSSSLFFPQI